MEVTKWLTGTSNLATRGPSVARMCETLVRLSADQPQTCSGRKRQP
jgi:hypothetical protein